MKIFGIFVNVQELQNSRISNKIFQEESQLLKSENFKLKTQRKPSNFEPLIESFNCFTWQKFQILCGSKAKNDQNDRKHRRIQFFAFHFRKISVKFPQITKKFFSSAFRRKFYKKSGFTKILQKVWMPQFLD